MPIPDTIVYRPQHIGLEQAEADCSWHKHCCRVMPVSRRSPRLNTRLHQVAAGVR